jgi:hypothetical protein
MRDYRVPAVLLVSALGAFALIAAPAHSQTNRTQIVTSVTLSNPTAAPKSTVQATLVVANYATVQAQGYASLLWCDLNSVPTPIRRPGGTDWKVTPQVSNCKPANGEQTLLPRVAPRGNESMTINNLVVPDACPTALVTRFGGSPSSDLNNPTVAITTPLYPTRPGRTELSVQSINIAPDAKDKARRNVTAAYTITLKTPPKMDPNTAIILELCQAERCEVKVRQAPPSALKFTMAKEKVGEKLENRWVATGTLNATFVSGASDYFRGQANEVRVFMGSKKIEDYHIVEPRCEAPNTVFKQTF